MEDGGRGGGRGRTRNGASWAQTWLAGGTQEAQTRGPEGLRAGFLWQAVVLTASAGSGLTTGRQGASWGLSLSRATCYPPPVGERCAGTLLLQPPPPLSPPTLPGELRPISSMTLSPKSQSPSHARLSARSPSSGSELPSPRWSCSCSPGRATQPALAVSFSLWRNVSVAQGTGLKASSRRSLDRRTVCVTCVPIKTETIPVTQTPAGRPGESLPRCRPPPVCFLRPRTSPVCSKLHRCISLVTNNVEPFRRIGHLQMSS